MGVRVEVVPFLIVALVVGALVSLGCRLGGVGVTKIALSGGITALVLCLYFLYYYLHFSRKTGQHLAFPQ